MREEAPVRGWRATFPPARWLPAYQASWLPGDAIAGVTLAAYGIPVSLAYASLAGLPPQYGVYGYLVGGLAYALFGSSRQLAIGPTSAISLLVGVTVAEMAAGNPEHRAAVAALTALVTAGMCVIAWAFSAELAGQLHQRDHPPRVQGRRRADHRHHTAPQALRGEGWRRGLLRAARRPLGPARRRPVSRSSASASPRSSCCCSASDSCPGSRSRSGWWCSPSSCCPFTSLGALGFQVVGALPRGLPHLTPPGLRPREVDGLIPLAFACLLLSYVESVSAARALAARHRQQIDPRQELLGLGAANLAGRAPPVLPRGRGLSQSSVNDGPARGRRCRWSSPR